MRLKQLLNIENNQNNLSGMGQESAFNVDISPLLNHYALLLLNFSFIFLKSSAYKLIVPVP